MISSLFVLINLQTKAIILLILGVGRSLDSKFSLWPNSCEASLAPPQISYPRHIYSLYFFLEGSILPMILSSILMFISLDGCVKSFFRLVICFLGSLRCFLSFSFLVLRFFTNFSSLVYVDL